MGKKIKWLWLSFRRELDKFFQDNAMLKIFIITMTLAFMGGGILFAKSLWQKLFWILAGIFYLLISVVVNYLVDVGEKYVREKLEVSVDSPKERRKDA